MSDSENPVLISIGCDCHPAYVLTSLGLRNKSLPFDWLDTNPLRGLEYACHNIKTDFEFFLKDLDVNEHKQVFSRHYDYSVFFHHPQVIEKGEVYKTYERRIARLREYIKRNVCLFLYTIGVKDFKSSDDIDAFVKSATDFMSEIKQSDALLIYLRHENKEAEQRELCDKALSTLENLDRVYLAEYVRDTVQFGIWGDESKYPELLEALGVKVTFPGEQ